MTKWRTSSHSANHGGQCVEIGSGPDTVAIRDSKNRTGGQLAPAVSAFSAFIAAESLEKSVFVVHI
ncbi:DUF397 domain-containing protein [Streptoalloteichus hindustanus]|uniref:DUF397 domain-containing protein n=1 Tax=Streptoalloteichus hindustanus TaxID=2017 RepID=A0A1M5DPW0_STRHI|nr:DUF397 domain-containing protein [Streptoalloteichus hindustanus]SHF69019.1 protein of unknown function [Streptoalloteichus hindustanus]